MGSWHQFKNLSSRNLARKTVRASAFSDRMATWLRGEKIPGDWVLDIAKTSRCCRALDKSPSCLVLSLFHKGTEVDSRLDLNPLLVTYGFENVVKSTSPPELPWWLSSKEFACQWRRCEFDSWVGKKEKEMATYSSILAWEILWTEKTVRLQSMGSQTVRHDSFLSHTHTYTHNHFLGVT